MDKKGYYCALDILDKYVITKPNEIPLEDIIINEGPFITEKNMFGAEGRLVCYEDYALISVNSSITDISKKRFILAHELGHFLMHRNLNPFYHDTENNFWEWNCDKKIETEANEFAAELLMPTNIFLNVTRKYKFSIDFIHELKNAFSTSLTATSIRFAQKGHDPILLICSKNNIVKWYVKNDDFPFSKIIVNKEVPINTVTSEYYIKSKSYSKPEDIEPQFWHISDKFYGKLKYYEQCIYFDYYGYVLTFVWLEK